MLTLFVMAKRSSSSVYRQEFINRVRQARENSGLTQQQVADVFQVKQDVYKQYETRSIMPHRYIAAFCVATRVSEKWLLTGRERRIAAE